ncbi:MAG: glycyl-radical enzyme activating protein [Candidatus Korarchaeum sp.]
MSSGIVFDIQRFAIHDGPGIRTNVFMKGCPLRCWWCQNPEGISPEPQVMYFEFKCIHCHLCCDACPRGAIGVTEGDLHVINRSLCDGCGICADNCPSGALKLVGKVYTVDQLMEEIKKDVPYYDSSGGGVTFTGGEPLFQPRFLGEVLSACRELGIHTAIETSGFVSREVMRSLVSKIDLFLHDIKLLDDEESKYYTGVPSGPMVGNLRFLVESGRRNDVIARFPVIPTITNTDKNLKMIRELLLDLGIEEIHLLPYHDVKEKYDRLGIPYRMEVRRGPSKEELNQVKRFFEEAGLKVVLYG